MKASISFEISLYLDKITDSSNMIFYQRLLRSVVVLPVI